MISRRSLLASSSALLLAACDSNGNLKTANIAAVAADVNTVATAFQNSLTVIAGMPNVQISADTLNKAQLALTGLRGAAVALSGVTDVAAAQPIVQQVETYVSTFVAAVSTVPLLPPKVQTYLQVANVLLPVIFLAVNMAAPPTPAPVAAAVAPALTPDQARAVATK